VIVDHAIDCEHYGLLHSFRPRKPLGDALKNYRIAVALQIMFADAKSTQIKTELIAIAQIRPDKTSAAVRADAGDVDVHINDRFAIKIVIS
jgi:hypothetical protein